MTKTWPKVRLADILVPITREETIEGVKEYRLLGVRLDGQGPFLRETITGVQSSASKLSRVACGDFIYSRLFAWRGAFGVIGPELDGCYVSGEFPTFVPKTSELVDVRFLRYWFRLPSTLAKVEEDCTGSTPLTRNRFKESFFLELEIPLPSFPEQQRIVSRIEVLAAKVAEAKALRKLAAKETEALFSSALSLYCVGKATILWRDENPNIESASDLLTRIAKNKLPGQVSSRERKPMNLPLPPSTPVSWLTVEAGELQNQGAILDIQDGNHGGDYPRKAEFGAKGVPFITAKQIKGGTVCIAEAPRLPKERANCLRIGFAKPGDVLLTHNASVGDVAVAPSDAGDFLLGTSVTYWRCNPKALEPRYLFYFMQSEHFQGQLQFIMKQTTRNQVSVLKQVNLWICLPPIVEQCRIVQELDRLHAKLDQLNKIQGDTAIELDAIMPSTFDKAFRGEL